MDNLDLSRDSSTVERGAHYADAEGSIPSPAPKNPFKSGTNEYYRWRYQNVPGVRAKILGHNNPPEPRTRRTPEERKRLAAEYTRKLYRENKEYRAKSIARAAAKSKALSLMMKTEAAKIKAACGCKFCGEKEPACLDFHHRDRSEKKFSIGAFWGKAYNLDQLREEIAKCDVLCANCHRKHHAGLI